MTLQEFLAGFEGVRKVTDGYMVRCVAHDDRTPSLSVREQDGWINLKCFAGCSKEDILRIRGLTAGDLRSDSSTNVPRHSSSPGETYNYVNQNGEVEFQVRRSAGKKFRAYHHDGKGWVAGLNGHRKILYRLNEVAAAKSVYIVEGEKDADTMTRLGFVATCNPFGAGNWLPEYSQSLRGKTAIVIPDNDEPGRKHAQGVAESLIGIAEEIFIVTVPTGKDVSDYVEAGGTADDIMDLVQRAEPWSANRVQGSVPVPNPARVQRSAIVSLDSLITTYPNLRPPVIEGLVRVGEVVNVVAKAKVGKSWLLYYILLSIATGSMLFGRFRCSSGPVLLIDNELHKEDIAHRIPIVAEAMGLRPSDYRGRLDVLSLRGRLQNVNDLAGELNGCEGKYQLIALDALYRALPEGVAENTNEGMASVYNRLDQYAEMTGSAFLNVHHATKGGQGDKDVTDVGSGAGAQSRAADTHMILRPHRENDCVVLDAVTRSWQPIEPLPLRWEYPLWRPAAGLDPEALKGRSSRYTEEQEGKDAEGKEKILTALKVVPDTIKGLKGRVGMGSARIERLVGSLYEERKVNFEPVKIRGQECRRYFAV